MKKYQYNINGINFTSKKSVTDHVKNNIYKCYEDNVPIKDEHLKFMIGLLRHHEYSDQKIGVGVRKMWIQPNEFYPTKSFWLERVDGTKTDFSFYQCVSPSSLMRDFKQACRCAISSVVIEEKQKFFKKHGGEALCPILKEKINVDNSHVDHEPPNTFENIVNNYINDHKIDVNKAPLAEHNDGKIGNYFTDPDFENKWVEFHNSRAKLRVISAKANLSDVKF